MLIVTAINTLLLLLVGFAYAIPLPARDPGWSVVVEYRDGTPAYVFLSPDEKWRLQSSVARIEPKLVEALVALEDKRFWSHHGVDPIAISRAAITDLIHARRVSGGSTLSMQLARLLEPRARTIPNKLVDMFRAVQLDLRLSKREILEEYLSRTPYGENVEGVESAAWSYFGHGAQHLTPLEIATLLAVPQGPARFAPSTANVPRLRARRDAILAKLIAAGVFSPVDATQALAELATAPPDHLRAMPREASHVAVALRARHRDDPRIRSTLDAGAQHLVERQVAMRTPELRRKGIFGGAVVVVDHGTREVVALVGNLDFTDALHGGQIAMFDRPRSPGSTLKPFLYALAIDRGLALPGYLVPDVPMQYGTYRPRNFDGDWAGLVTMRDALSRSLNMPFIDLLQQLGVEPFVAELGRMGVSVARIAPGQYGLSLIVGGIELTPLELAGMYATLAENGVYRPLRLTASDPQVAPVPVFGAGAAWLTRDALSQKDRPDFPKRRDVTAVPAEIHWKTGTSFGFRDAWAVGSGPAYTAVVWTGNVDNKPSADLIGSEAAGPLLFDVLEGVADRRHGVVSGQPGDLTEIEVCAYSGHIPSDACDHRIKVLAPIHAVPTTPCPYHQAFDVDVATSRAVPPACRIAGTHYERKSFVVLPSSVNAWLTQRNRSIPEAPVFADGCATDTAAGPPVMVTPSEGQVIMLLPGVPAKSQVVPLTVTTRSATVSWFVDGALVGTAPASERQFWTPSPGKHEVVVSDEAGRKARRSIEVTAVAPAH
ncbi:MAG: penicillin-binding protein [Myxococcales bacterium]|nr:penicillin-binding protein [Myxococcales bacterium]